MPSRSLRSANKITHVVPEVKTVTYGKRNFSITGLH